MLGRISSLARSAATLVRAGWVLARYDALVPHSVAGSVPAPVRALGWLARKTGPEPVAGVPAVGTSPPNALRNGLDPEIVAQGERLASALHRLGPSYIKLGQVLATRGDIVGASLAQGLSGLRDAMPPFEQSEALETVEQELGAPAESIFAEFGPPIAAASIAQVHKARLPSAGAEGQAVAVKILRPGVEAAFARDLSAFRHAAEFAEWIRPSLKRLRPVKVVETLQASVDAEMDLRLEAAAASQIAENTAADRNFRVPRIDWTRTARRVLTAEWIDGVPLSDRAAVVDAGHDVSVLAERLLQTFLTHALRDGFFHADMHQGNLFVDAEGRIVAVDFGIMGRLDRATRRYTAEILYGFLTRDYARIARQHFEAGYVAADKSEGDFALALRAVGEKVWGRPARDVSMARLLTQLFDVTRRFDMELQPGLLMLQKTMVVVEGVARDLDPDMNIWEASRPVLETWMVGEMGPEARLRDAADGARELGRVMGDLPTLLRAADHAALALTEEGLKLHPDTARRIGEEEARAARSTRWPLWIGAGALVALALSQIL
jgi:ubiquinone biosynthesis protein